jgi:hypothetical protein
MCEDARVEQQGLAPACQLCRDHRRYRVKVKSHMVAREGPLNSCPRAHSLFICTYFICSYVYLHVLRDSNV